MLTLLLVVVTSGLTFGADIYNVEEDVQAIERGILLSNRDAAAAIAESNVELEPVHTSSIWPSFCSSNVEHTACNDSIQDETYFK